MIFKTARNKSLGYPQQIFGKCPNILLLMSAACFSGSRDRLPSNNDNRGTPVMLGTYVAQCIPALSLVLCLVTSFRVSVVLYQRRVCSLQVVNEGTRPRHRSRSQRLILSRLSSFTSVIHPFVES